MAPTRHTLTLVDRSRPTPAGGGLAAEPGRTLVTAVHRPEGAGPFPTVVFAHGLGGHPRKFTRLLDAWAAVGYLVAAPRFPRTSDDVPGDPWLDDVVHQPGDVRFVIDELVVRNLADPSRIGAAGLSLGGMTALGVTYDRAERDRRLRAALSMAGALYPFSGGYDLSGPPLLVLHGDADAVVPYHLGRETFDRATTTRWLVTLRGGGHSAPFEDDLDPADDVVRDTTLAFWDLCLRGDPDAAGRLAGAVTARPHLATLEHR